MPSARGVASTVETGARYGSRYPRRTSVDAIHPAPANMIRPATGPRRIRTLRFVASFHTSLVTGPPSLGVGGPGGCACETRALELPHVGDDGPPVCGRNRPAVPGHQSKPVRDHVEDLPVRILQDLFLVEGGGWDVGSLEQDPPAVAA